MKKVKKKKKITELPNLITRSWKYLKGNYMHIFWLRAPCAQKWVGTTLRQAAGQTPHAPGFVLYYGLEVQIGDEWMSGL